MSKDTKQAEAREPGEIVNYTDLFTPEDLGGKSELGLPLPKLPEGDGPRERQLRELEAQQRRVQERGLLPSATVPDGIDYARTQVDQYRTPVDPDDETKLANGLPNLRNRPLRTIADRIPTLGRARRRRTATRRPDGTRETTYERVETVTQEDCTELRWDAVAQCAGARGGPCNARWHNHGPVLVTEPSEDGTRVLRVPIPGVGGESVVTHEKA